MRVLVTGATGYVGSAIAAAFLNGVNEVTGTGRDAAKAAGLVARGMKFAPVDLGDVAALQRLASEHAVVIHAAMDPGPDRGRVDVAATQALLAGCATGRQRVFVYTSGVWLLGATAGADEATPITAPPPRSAWRQEVEPKVLAASNDRLRTAVIRPGRVFGGKEGAFAGWFEAALRGEKLKVIGDGSARWATVHRDDLADLYRRVVEGGAPGGVYHATDETSRTALELAKAMAAAANAPGIELWPLEQARAALGDFADGLALDQVVRSTASRKLGWLPRHGDPVLAADRIYDEYVATPPES